MKITGPKWPSFWALPYIKYACLLSQLHLNLFAGPTQRAKLHLYAVRQNRGVGNCSLKGAGQLTEGRCLAAVTPGHVKASKTTRLFSVEDEGVAYRTMQRPGQVIVPGALKGRDDP